MRKIRIDYSLKIKAEPRIMENERYLDYYIVGSNNERYYAFRKKYSNSTYELCKNGMALHKLRYYRTNNKAIMLLVKNLNRSMDYLLDYYELSA